MLQPEKIFGNIFANKYITPLRLSNFSKDAITKFTVANTDGKYTATIDLLTASQKPFIDGLSTIDTSNNIKKGKTKGLKEVKEGFVTFMSNQEGVIANAIGGFNSAAFLSFYPHGVTEYTSATKTQMPILVKRVNAAAAEYAGQLNSMLIAQLQSFEGQWEMALHEQTTVVGSLSEGRAERENLRIALETALLTAIHFVAQQYPGNVAKCMSFFNFNLLTGVSQTAPQPVSSSS